MTDYSKYEFRNREDAENVLKDMNDILDKYGGVSVADFCDLCGMKCEYVDHTYGWTDLSHSKVYANRPGTYSILLPQALKFPADTPEDVVNHPSHYQSKSGLETIQVIDAFTADLVGTEAVCTGNILKYMCRWKSKNGLQDLEKAKWYLEHLINHIKKESE